MAEEQEAPVYLVFHVNNSLHSRFSNIEVHINNLQIYKSNGLYAYKFYISNNFNGVISEYRGFLHCKRYDYEGFLDEMMEMTLSEPLFTRRMNMLSIPAGVMLYGRLGVDFSTTPELLYPKLENGLRLNRTNPNFP